MRTESYEKPKVVKEMAREFTEFMKIHKFKKLPVFKISSITYNEMLANQDVFANTLIEAEPKEPGIRGTVYGVWFRVEPDYFGPIKAE